MPELRKDPIIGRWVIISTERGKRPSAFQSVSARHEAALCPFCPGHEDATPPEVLAYREPGSEPNRPGWKLRVISNKYPALRIEGDLNQTPKGIYERMDGVGAHEVIIETPDHARDLAEMTEDEMMLVLRAYRERMLDLERDNRFQYILVFKNHGVRAGASLEHSHSQLIATPIVPKRVAEELEGSRRYYNFKERCVFCDILTQELMESDRVVRDFDSFLAFQPFASRFPFETWILPKSHQSHFLEMSDAEARGLAICLRDSLIRLKLALNDPPFNFILHTRPVGKERFDHYHWHFEIIPKLTRVAGFEWGSGFYINPTLPEEAAMYLRSMDPSALGEFNRARAAGGDL